MLSEGGGGEVNQMLNQCRFNVGNQYWFKVLRLLGASIVDLSHQSSRLVPRPRNLDSKKQNVSSPLTCKNSLLLSLRGREVECSPSDRQGSNFESYVWRAVSSLRSFLLAQVCLYVHRSDLLKHYSLFHITARKCVLPYKA